jgi:hypothetical protein
MSADMGAGSHVIRGLLIPTGTICIRLSVSVIQGIRIRVRVIGYTGTDMRWAGQQFFEKNSSYPYPPGKTRVPAACTPYPSTRPPVTVYPWPVKNFKIQKISLPNPLTRLDPLRFCFFPFFINLFASIKTL